MKKFFIFFITVLCISAVQAQNVGIGTTSPNSSSLLDITSTTKGLLVPRMSDIQRDAITNPATGLLVFVNTDSTFYYYGGSGWIKVLPKTEAWGLTGNANATGKFIGTLDTSALRIYTRNTEKLNIDSTGNITLSYGARKIIRVANASSPNITGYDLTLAAGNSRYQAEAAASGGNLYLKAGRGNSANGHAGGDIILSTGINYWANGTNPSAEHGDIIFMLDGLAELMRLHGTTGNLGIGTATPKSKLDVNGDIQISNASVPMGLITEIGGFTPILNMSVNFREPDKNTAYRGADFRIDTRDNAPIFQWFYRPKASATEINYMGMDSTGKLAIGGTNPTEHLHIYGNNSQGIMLESPTGGGTVNLLKVRTWSGMAANTYVGFGGTDDGNNSARASIYVPNAANTGVMEAVSILKSSGNVGIGIIPTTKFQVEGSTLLTGGYTIMNTTTDNSGGNVTIGELSTFSNGKLYVKSNQTYGLYIDDQAALSNALFVSGSASISGNLSKGGGSFKIDHPLDPANKFLYHSFVESPDMMNVYNGNITTDADGKATVTLPDYFEALNKDFRYQLTVIGSFAQAIIAEEVKDNKFMIKTDKPSVKVSWQVTGIRHDAFANKNRIPNAEDKVGEEKGLYIHPDAFGLSEEYNIKKTHLKRTKL